MLEARLRSNEMGHFLAPVERMRCSGPCRSASRLALQVVKSPVNVPARSVAAVDSSAQPASGHRPARSEQIHSFFISRYGLLRGACHRARVRATLWLAMTGRAWVPNVEAVSLK